MRKTLVLWRNELTRMVRRTYVLVLFIIMTALCLITCGGMKLLSTVFSSEEVYYYEDGTDPLEEQLEWAESELQYVNSTLKDLEPGSEEYVSFITENQYILQEYEYCKILKEYGLSYYDTVGYLDSCAYSLADLRVIEQYPDCFLSASYVSAEEYEAILKDQNYQAYIELQKSALSLQNLSEEERAIEAQALDYVYLCDPEGVSYYQSEVETWKSAKLGLLNERYEASDGTYKPLTEELRKSLQNQIAVSEYKFENGLAGSTGEMDLSYTEGAATTVMGICSSFLLFLLLILSGSCISGEIQSGAIKGLIIAPVKRSKIFFAKVLALLTVALSGMVIGTLLTTLTHGIFFGFGNLPVYVYAVNGTAHTLPGVIYILGQIFAELLPLFMIMSFAMMLSAMSRNTAVAVGVSIAGYYLCGIAYSVISMGLFKGEWIKFLPFQHMELLATVFPYSTTSDLMSMMGFSTAPSLGFSLAYLAVVTLTFGYAAFDSFTRRDI